MDIQEEIRKGKSIHDLALRVTYYARVSTEHEEQSTSIVNQLDYFSRYIQNHAHWFFVPGYVDEGISGKAVEKRESFLKMIEDGKKHHFDLILTKSVSRFARNTIDSIYYTESLLQQGIGVFFLNDNINTFYSDSEFRLTLMASIAQDELRKLSESVKFGLRQSIERGVVLGNNNLLGYQKAKGKLVIHSNEAKIVQDIYQWFSTDKYNYREVSKFVFDKYQKKLDSTGIKRILMNYKYKGYYCGGKTKVIDYKKNKRKNIEKENWIIYPDYSNIPPIVDETTWNKVQEIIRKRKKTRTKNLISIFCMKHQRTFLFKKKKYKDTFYFYYYCPKCCSFPLNFLEKIWHIYPFSKIWVYPKEDDYLLKVFKCK